MIERIGYGNIIPLKKQENIQNTQANKTKMTVPSFSAKYNAAELVNAYQAFHGIKTAKTISFGASLAKSIDSLRDVMYTCKDESKGKKGEEVGKKVKATEIIQKHKDDLPYLEDALKTNVTVNIEKDKNMPSKPAKITEARTQIKRTPVGILYEMAVRQPRLENQPFDRKAPLKQLIQIIQDFDGEPQEQAYVLNTKGNLMAVIEDNDDVILTNAGTAKRIYQNPKQKLIVHAEQKGNNYAKFTPIAAPLKVREHKPSIGQGTEIVIGMEDGRFVPEIIDSIESFVKKVNDGEIILDQFVANKDAKNTQLAMLAGGFGSRAEYTNASSDGIFHGVKNGAQSTKGVFKTATGLTPMETTFISLHNAGLLDCSKGKLKIGDNIKLYLNQSGVNKGNGGFTVDLYNKMNRSGRKSLTLFPNDSMSRMPKATKEMADIMNSGKAAIVMISKKVKANDAKGNLGIMKIDPETHEILEFKEKPKSIPTGYADKNNMCLTNTFQFSVSKEAFGALAALEEFFPESNGKEPRDWSKTYIPILMSLTQNNDIDKIRKDIAKTVDTNYENIPRGVVQLAKQVLHGQKIISVPTEESWADCGSLNALYHTTMEIASGEFKLEDFERQHVLDSINTETGLVASTKEQKDEIEKKYVIDGEVMVVPKAKKIDHSIVDKYIKDGLIAVNKSSK